MDEEGFDDFRVRWEHALGILVRGDMSALQCMIPRSDSASFHCFAGDTLKGGERIVERLRSDASQFGKDGSIEFEVIQQGLAGEVGFWTGFQIANLRMADAPKPTTYRMRVTEIFRKLDGAWKMIHRHADASDTA